MNKKYRDCSLQLCIFNCKQNQFSDVKKNNVKKGLTLSNNIFIPF